MNEYRTANKHLIKRMNTALVLQMVREHGPISRAHISRMTGLNPATVSSNLEPLLDLGIVQETGSGQSSGGRKPVLLALDGDACHAIAIDMGTTKVQAAFVNLNGKVKRATELAFNGRKSPQAVLGIMEKAVRHVLRKQESERRPSRILGIGIGFHGLVDSTRGVSLFAPAFQWTGVEVRERFERTFSLPVIVDNDARAMALAEKWFGAAREIEDFVFLNIGTGVGSGLYAHGRLLRGFGFGAGEIGHIPLVDNGIRCYCGNIGCLHTVASGPAIERQAREKYNARDAPELFRLTGGNADKVDGALISEAARAGDGLAQRLLKEAGIYVGRALAMAVNLLNPEQIFVGGGVAQAGDWIVKSMEKEMKARSMQNHVQNIRISMATFGSYAGLAGAGTLVLSEFFAHPDRFLEGQSGLTLRAIKTNRMDDWRGNDDE